MGISTSNIRETIISVSGPDKLEIGSGKISCGNIQLPGAAAEALPHLA